MIVRRRVTAGFVLGLLVAGSLAADTFRDEFSTVTYGANDGDQTWSGPWVESNDDGRPDRGDIQVFPTDTGNGYAGLRLSDNDVAVEREADLSSYSAATLSFTYRRRSLDNPNDFVALEISGDGGNNWDRIATFAGNAQDFAPQPYSVDITGWRANNTRIRFVSSPNLGSSDRVSFDDVQIEATSSDLVAAYFFDELEWRGDPGEVLDSSGADRHGTVLGLVAGVDTIDDGRVCKALDVPANSGNSDQWGVDTGIDVDSVLGANGNINFWYRANEDWQGGGVRMLLDASTTSDAKYFFLILLDSGRLQFGMEDTSDRDLRFETSRQNFSAGEWVHIAVNWDMGGSGLEVWANGVRIGSYSRGNTGVLGDVGTLYIGDNRSTYHPGGASSGGPSAAGSIDELRIYDSPLSAARIAEDRDRTHPCRAPVAQYRLEAANWDGSPNEVRDSSGNNLHGSMVAGNQAARTDTAAPALVGNPGTCGYGVFAGSNAGYVRIPHDPRLSAPSELTVTAWFNPDRIQGGLKSLVSKDENFEFHLTGREINWWWGGGYRSLTSSGANIQAGRWHHVAIVYSQSGGFHRLYVDGVLRASGTNPNATLTLSTRPVYIGADIDTGNGNIISNRTFEGLIDEVQLYEIALTDREIATVMRQTHPCAAAATDHYAISHGGTGISCLPSQVTISAHDASHNVVGAGGATISLDTDTGRGNWSAIVSGGGTLNTTLGNDGQASYQFSPTGDSVTLAFDYTDLAGAQSETVNLNINAGGGTGEAAGEDPDLVVSLAGLRLFNPADNTTAIPVQLAGKPSDTGYSARSLLLQALKTSDADPSVCVPLFPPGTSADIEVGGECRDPGICGAGTLEAGPDATSLAALPTSNDNGGSDTAAYTPVTLTFGADAGAPLALRYNEAGQVQLHARYPLSLADPAATPSGDYLAGASAPITVRPFGFALDFQAAGNWDRATNGTGGLSVAAGASGTAFRRAGEDFLTRLVAVAWAPGEDTDADGIPDAPDDLHGNAVTQNFGTEAVPETAVITHQLAAPSGGDPGTLVNAAFGSFSSGASSRDLQYSEVGIVHLRAALVDNDYLGSGETVTGAARNVGRFYPAHFSLSRGMLDNRPALTPCSSPFTYMDEPLLARFTLTAENLAGTRTRNYRGAFATLDTATELNAQMVDTVVGDNLTGRTRVESTNPDPIAFSDGELALDALLALARPADETGPYAGPYEAMAVAVAPVDDDGVALESFDTDVDGDAILDAGRVNTNLTALRFGRLRMENSFGPETSALRIPLRAEFWDGSAFVTSVDDDCTPFDDSVYREVVAGVPPLVLSDFTGSLQSGETAWQFPATTATLDQGESPLAPQSQWLFLSAPGDGNTGSVTATLSANDDHLPAWLRYRWSHCGASDCGPQAIISFGHYRGHDRIIYSRERHD